MLFDGTRNFDSFRWIRGAAMRHRQHRHQRFTVLLTLDRKRDDTGAILAPLFLSFTRFMVPNIGLRDDKARLGRRNGHTARYIGSSCLLR